jgi:hypothetical protein
MRAGADFVLTAAAISFLRRYCFAINKTVFGFNPDCASGFN